jgi:hypothetical protein
MLARPAPLLVQYVGVPSSFDGTPDEPALGVLLLQVLLSEVRALALADRVSLAAADGNS